MTGAIAIMRRNKTEQLREELGMTLPLIIELPYPLPELNPNRKCHWAMKAKAAASYKRICHALLMVYRYKLKGMEDFVITFRPPDKRGRDLDNAVASFKAGFDALSIVTGVNDKHFGWKAIMGEPTPDGAVIITLADDALDLVNRMTA